MMFEDDGRLFAFIRTIWESLYPRLLLLFRSLQAERFVPLCVFASIVKSNGGCPRDPPLYERMYNVKLYHEACDHRGATV